MQRGAFRRIGNRNLPWGVKRRRRFRSGFVALRTVYRLDRSIVNDRADPDYVVPPRRRVSHDEDDQAFGIVRPVTRWEVSPFIRAAKLLLPLAVNHHPNDELVPYQQFKDLVLAAGATEVTLREHHVIMSGQGSWYDQILRFTKKAQKNQAIRDGGIAAEDFWRHSNTTLSRAVTEIQYYMNHYNQPISLLVGQQSGIRGFGHCRLVIVYPKSLEEMQQEDWLPVNDSQRNRKWGILVKDTHSFADASVSTLARSLSRALNIRKMRVVGELPRELEVTNTCCIKEGLVGCGSVLQGQFPSELLRVRARFIKVYDSVANSYEYFPFEA